MDPINPKDLTYPSHPVYTWHPAYHAAVRETENALMMLRILEARAAIEQRLLSPVEKDGTEFRELMDAQSALELLRLDEADKIARLRN
jgi:hypothetical protein